MPCCSVLNANRCANGNFIKPFQAHKMIKYISLLVFLHTLQNSVAQKTIIINNTKPRITTDGKIVDAHDGRIIQFGNKFYWYGTQYGSTNGFTKANTYVCYSSNDLTKWTYEGKLLQGETTGVYYRPHVVYNAATKKYVLWYNWYPKLWDGQFGVATSSQPTGPFTVQNDNVTVKQNALGVGDLGVFVDDDGVAYLSYNTIQNHKVSVEKLDANYTASTLQGSDFIAEHCEAGGMFKRNGWYYLLTDYTCCFCTQGSGARVFMAKNPLGPYRVTGNINRYPGKALPVLSDGAVMNNNYETFTFKENNYAEAWLPAVQTIRTVDISIYVGDRNGQCGEVDNPVLHQPITILNWKIDLFIDGSWLPAKGMDSSISKTTLLHQYKISIKNVQAEKIRLTPLFKDTTQYAHIAEISLNGGQLKNVQYFKCNGWDAKPIIPAQQTYIMELQTAAGKQFIWMGDLWGSSNNNIKGQDFQYWSKPLVFYKNGGIKNLQWDNDFSIQIQ